LATFIKTPPAAKRRRGKSPDRLTPTKTIWFIPVDHQRQLSFGDSTKLDIQAHTDVDDLKEMIKEKKRKYLTPFDPDELDVCGHTNYQRLAQSGREKLRGLVGSIEFSDGRKNPQLLSSRQKVMEIDLPEVGILLVQVPVGDPAAGVTQRTNTDTSLPFLLDMMTQCLRSSSSTFSSFSLSSCT